MFRMDEPMSLEELAVLAELLGKFCGKCGSIGDKLKVSAVMGMVTEASVREVKKQLGNWNNRAGGEKDV